MKRPARSRTLRPYAGRLGLLAALLLAACRSAPVLEPSPPPPAVAASAAPPAAESASAVPARPSLAAEQSRLAALFRGTPVAFAMQPDGSLRVVVPLRYCFAPGQSSVRPPLAAVLDRVALSQMAGTSRIAVSASADPPPRGKPTVAAAARRERLAGQRVVSVRDYLSSKGIAVGRMSATPVASGSAVQLLVDDHPQP